MSESRATEKRLLKEAVAENRAWAAWAASVMVPWAPEVLAELPGYQLRRALDRWLAPKPRAGNLGEDE